VLDGEIAHEGLSLLLVESDRDHAAVVREAIRRAEPNLRIVAAASLRQAVHALHTARIACVVTNLWLTDAEGVHIIRDLRGVCPDVPVIVVTEGGSEDVAVAALRAGATDYVSETGHELAELPALIREALGRAVLAGAEELAEDTTQYVAHARDGLIAVSTAMQQVASLVERAARSRAPVLIEGETGTGKEVIARAIHARSARRDAPFVVQNCAAITEGLLETELFGHRRGSFTGADRDRHGLFVEAGDGTVFLDEVADAPSAVQAKLLRVLQHEEVKAVGADTVRRVRARILAATNRALESEVQAGRFRSDLYYRLAVFPIRIPPLRRRAADVRVLIPYFLRRFEEQEGRATGGLDAEALRILEAYAWPGNVRELENEIHRLVLSVRQERRIRRGDLARRIRDTSPARENDPLSRILQRVEIAVIRERIRQEPSKAAAARSLGITREALYAKMRRLGIWNGRGVEATG
jgi:two-component system response regulator HydG